jgi:hypothetical protein
MSSIHCGGCNEKKKRKCGMEQQVSRATRPKSSSAVDYPPLFVIVIIIIIINIYSTHCTYSLVRVSVVTRESTKFDVAFGKLLLTLAGFSQLGSANGRVIGGMHKDDTPRVAQVLVQIKRVRVLRRTDQVGELSQKQRERKKERESKQASKQQQ